MCVKAERMTKAHKVIVFDGHGRRRLKDLQITAIYRNLFLFLFLLFQKENFAKCLKEGKNINVLWVFFASLLIQHAFEEQMVVRLLHQHITRWHLMQCKWCIYIDACHEFKAVNPICNVYVCFAVLCDLIFLSSCCLRSTHRCFENDKKTVNRLVSVCGTPILNAFSSKKISSKIAFKSILYRGER